MLALGGNLVPVADSRSTDYGIPGGWFYTQSGGDTRDPQDGFAVRDDSEAMFWTAFGELGGVETIGYPVTNRFKWQGFTTQAFQKAVLQWRPEAGTVAFANVFDDLNRLGYDGALEESLIPPQESFSESGLAWHEVIAGRLALLDEEPALREAYQALDDPLRWYGLPQSGVREFGNGLLRTIRLQRAVLQLWTREVPWASAGTVTVANGGEEAKAVGMWPAAASQPQQPPIHPGTRFGVLREGQAELLWEIPFEPEYYPRARYRTEAEDGVAIVRTGYAGILALDLVSGRVLWEYELTEKGARIPYWEYDGKVYLTRYFNHNLNEFSNRGVEPTLDLVAIDARSGVRIWQYWDLSGGEFTRLYFWQNTVTIESSPPQALDRKSGQRVWESRIIGDANHASAGAIFFERQSNVSSVDMATGAVKWSKDLGGLNRVQGASAGKLILGIDNAISAIDTATGTDSWAYSITGQDLRYSFLTDGLIVVEYWEPLPSSLYPQFPEPDGFCVLDAESGKELWCREIDPYFEIDSIGQEGALRVESPTRVALLDPQTGVELWGRALDPERPEYDPRANLAGGVIYETNAQEVAAFEPSTGAPLWRYAWERPVAPLLMEAADDVAIIWTGSSLIGLGVPAP